MNQVNSVTKAQVGGKTAIGVEAVEMTMQFGSFTALNNVSIKITPGSFHALLGENGAGKSTLVKCMMGFYQATAGAMLVNNREVSITHPRTAHALGLGMVYQHFTLVPSLTGFENLVINREHAPAVINWRQAREALQSFMQAMPFDIPLEQPVHRLAAGEKQKLEILKQLYLGRRFLVLDEPTSVLTPAEADDVLGLVRGLCEAGELTVLMITHKFREVSDFADEVTVLRRGHHAGKAQTADLSHDDMAAMMVGNEVSDSHTSRASDQQFHNTTPVLSLRSIQATDRSGLNPIRIDRLEVYAGEIVGIAGVSGNGQLELVEILAGQRPYRAGEIRVNGDLFGASRTEAHQQKVRYLPEEPLRNACSAKMTVAENLAFRSFDIDKQGKARFWLNRTAIKHQADELINRFKIKTTSLDNPVSTLSGGNVQRTVLARELSGAGQFTDYL